jgi:hypothetical protein
MYKGRCTSHKVENYSIGSVKKLKYESLAVSHCDVSDIRISSYAQCMEPDITDNN